MHKIVINKRNPRRDKRTVRLRMRRVRNPDGKMVSVPILDAEEPHFGLKLEAMFRWNVAKALKSAKRAAKTRPT